MKFRLILLAALFPLATAAEQCLVVGITDGDSLTARCGAPGSYEQVKVRLAGIDAPERKQAFGARSKEALSDIAHHKAARLDCVKADRYGRRVCNVWVAPDSNPTGPQTLDAGLAMVTVGMAWWYRAYSREQTPEARGQFEFAEFEAKARKVGLWRDVDPLAPWEWRKQQAAERAQEKAQH